MMEVDRRQTERGRAFAGLVVRDILILRKRLLLFTTRVVAQPLLVLFVFTYVLPRIPDQGAVTSQSFEEVLIPGVVGLAVLIQALQVLAIGVLIEVGYTGEMEDRVLAPLGTGSLAMAKVVSGALQALLAALCVLPFIYVVPDTRLTYAMNWPVLLTVLPLGCLVASAFGIALGTILDADRAQFLLAVIAIPANFLGAVFFSWSDLSSMRWLQVVILINPLVYINEGLRAAITGAPHMPLVGVYLGLSVLLVAFCYASAWGMYRRMMV